MKKSISLSYKFVISLLLAASFLAGIALVPVAAEAGGYQLSWGGASSGGGESIGGSYAMTSTIAMPDATGASGGGYTVTGGTVPEPYLWFYMMPAVRR